MGTSDPSSEQRGAASQHEARATLRTATRPLPRGRPSMRASCSSRAFFLAAASAAALASLCTVLLSSLSAPPVYPLGSLLSTGRAPGAPAERQASGASSSAHIGGTSGAQGKQGTADAGRTPAQGDSKVPRVPGEPSSPDTAVPPARLVAVGDLHGDMANALRLLQALGLVNASGSWVGGSATLVQTGDIMDRGPDSLALLRLFWRLKGEAAAANGTVVTLLGNHELMNLQGALHYVHSRELRQYGRRKWRADFGPSGEVGGRILRTRRLAALEGEGECRSLFVHAGLLPLFLSSWADIDALNADGLEAIARGVEEAEEGKEGREGAGRLLRALLSTQGPLWYRGYAEESEEKICSLLTQVLRWAGAHRMLIGHTPQHSIRTRCEGQLVLIDVGISRAYGGTPAAWECSLSKISVVSL